MVSTPLQNEFYRLNVEVTRLLRLLHQARKEADCFSGVELHYVVNAGTKVVTVMA